MPKDLGGRAQDFREQWLAISGGWLGELTISLSDATGVWDLTILTWIFVGAWIVIRTSPMEIAMILGLGFDMTIPLQYSNDESLSSLHQPHLEAYWPVFLMTTVIEGGSFFLIHPDLFTLIVCIKTTFTLFLWLGKDENGDAVSRRSSPHRSSSASHSNHEPRESSSRRGGSREGGSGGSGRGGSGRGSRRDREPSGPGGSRDRNRKSARDQSSSDTSSDSGSSSATPRRERSRKGGSTGGGRGSGASSGEKPSNLPRCKHFSDPHKYLKDKYSPEAIAGMIDALNKMDKEKAEKTLQSWRKEKDPEEIARRNKSYADAAKKKGWKPAAAGSGGSGGGGSGGSGRGKLAISQDEVKRVEAELKKRKVPSDQVKQILGVLKNPKSEEQVGKVASHLKKMGINVKTSGGSGGSGGSSSGPKHKLGEPDGHGLYRDIQIAEEDRKRLLKAMRNKGFPKADMKKWESYLKQPFSRREIENMVIPFSQRMDTYLGGGYFGGGKHGFKVEGLTKTRDALQEKLGVNQGMADHMILTAIKQDDEKKARALLDRWQKKGFEKGEYRQLEKTAPDWA